MLCWFAARTGGWLTLYGDAREAWRRTSARTLKVTVSSTETRAQAWVVLED